MSYLFSTLIFTPFLLVKLVAHIILYFFSVFSYLYIRLVCACQIALVLADFVCMAYC